MKNGAAYRALVLIQFVSGCLCISASNWRGAAVVGLSLLGTISVLLTARSGTS